MDFIEQWFGISPDGDSGSVEFMILVVVVLLIVVLAITLRRYLGHRSMTHVNSVRKRDHDDHPDS
jgi:hypothetical protein